MYVCSFCQPSQILLIYRIFARGLSQIFPIMRFGGKCKVRQKAKLEHKCERGTGAQQFRGWVMSEIHH